MKSITRHKAILACLLMIAFFGAFPMSVFSAPKIPVRLVLIPGKYDEKLNKCVGGPGLCSIDLEIVTGNSSVKDIGLGTAELKDGKLTISLELPLRGNVTKLPLKRDINLNPTLSKAFGFQKVTILSGDYEADRSKNIFGVFTFNLKTEGEIKLPQKTK